MGVDAKWGRFPICPEMSRFVPVCPLLSRFVPVPGRKEDKRGQTRTKRDISGQIGKRPHLASTPIKLSSTIFIARQADSHESLELKFRFARITPLREERTH